MMYSIPISITRDLYNRLHRPKAGLSHLRSKFEQIVESLRENSLRGPANRGKVETALDSNVYYSDIDDNYRLIWRLIDGREVILAHIGLHDPAFRWASRHRIELNREHLVRITDALDIDAPARSKKGLFALLSHGRDDILQHLTDKELMTLGVKQELIPALRSMKQLRALRSIEGLVPEHVFDRLYQEALKVVDLPPAPDEARIRRSLERFGGGEELVRFVNSEEFRRALEGSMEDWMLFLAPRQRRLVYATYSGSARVKGIAGSGKTVVAVHRARIMAQHNIKDRQKERILFLTFGNRLPDVNKRLLERLTNNGPEVEVIECRSIYSWVGSLLWHQKRRLRDRFPPEGELKVEKDEERLKEHLCAAIEEVKQQYPDLSLWKNPAEFFRDEIRYRIKGRGTLTLESYLALPGTGRGTPLREAARRAMFDVYRAYQKRLKNGGRCDWEDLILAALEHVDPNDHKYRYVGAVVDEIQDLNQVTMKLIRKMVAPGPNDLFLAGDGTQRIYKGGFSLGSASIDVKGRGAILRYNYRNTREIMRLAYAVMQDARIDDLDDDEAVALPEPEEVVRRGEVPVLRLFKAQLPEHAPEPQLAEIRDIIREIDDLKEKHGYCDGDFAILFRNRWRYRRLAEEHLKKQGYEAAVLLEEDESKDKNFNTAETYFGPGVKLVTMHSAKGLEFKVVLIVGLSDSLMPYFHEKGGPMSPEERDAHIEEERRLLYVAITRARDYLYMTCPPMEKCSRFLHHISQEILCRLEG